MQLQISCISFIRVFRTKKVFNNRCDEPSVAQAILSVNTLPHHNSVCAMNHYTHFPPTLSAMFTPYVSFLAPAAQDKQARNSNHAHTPLPVTTSEEGSEGVANRGGSSPKGGQN